MKAMALLLVMISSLLMVDISASCVFDKLKSEMTASKRIRFYCEYTKNGVPVAKLLPGSKLILADQCMDCSCTSDGLQCCGFGRNAGVVSFPDYCEALNDGCQSVLVLKANHSKSCTNETIDFTALSKNLPHPDNTYGLTGSSGRRPEFVYSQVFGDGRPGQPGTNNIRSRLYDYLNSMFPRRLPLIPGGPVIPQVTFTPKATTPAPTGVAQPGVNQQLPPVQQPPFFPSFDTYNPYGSSMFQSNDFFIPWLLFT